jgi:CDP-glucose 4,6-dehydratase
VEGLAVSDDGFTWSGRSVFVTGGTGLLGGWLTPALVERGARVVVLVRDWTPGCELFRSGTIDRISGVRGDLTDLDVLTRTLAEYEVDTVFHLAAQALVGVANAQPMSTFESNVRGTYCLLEACRQSPRVRQVVVASSDKAYGAAEALPYTEETPLAGRHPYDASKSCTDILAQTYAHSFGLPVAVVRCGNLFGGGDLNWSRIIPGTIRSALRGEAPVIRSDGTYVRDYLYVKDAVSGYVALAERMAADPGLVGQAFNLSNGQPVTVIDVATRVLRLMGRTDLRLDVRSEARNEIEKQYLDSSKAQRVLGWTSCYGLDDGLLETIEWYRAYLSEGDAGGGRSPFA